MGRGRSPRLSRETVAGVALEIKKRGKVPVAHLRLRFGGDDGLCPIGNAEPSRLQHGEVVCAIANRDHLTVRNPMRGGLLIQGGKLGFPSLNRLRNTRKAAIVP